MLSVIMLNVVMMGVVALIGATSKNHPKTVAVAGHEPLTREY
jgi:hypothetical protein